MATGDKPNSNLFGTDYNAEEEDRKRIEAEASLAAQNAMMGAGGVPATAFGQAAASNLFQGATTFQDISEMQGGVPETLAVDRTNLRPITAADANNPAFEGMSAGEIVEAINAPGYVSPGSVAMPGGSLPTSRFDRMLDDVTEMTGMAGDVVYGTGKMLANPLILGKNYIFGTPNNLNPTLDEAAIATMDTIAATPISDFMSGKTAASLPSEVLNAQDVRNAEFFNRQAAQAAQGTPNVNQVLKDGVGSFRPGAITFDPANEQQDTQEQQLSPELEIRQGAEGSPQKAFNDIISERPLTPEEIKAGKAFADRRGFDFNPQTGFSSINDPGSRTFDTPATLENFRNRGLSLGQFMRYEDDPSQRTEQFVDPQGRLRRRLTVDAATLQGFSPERIAQDRPLAPEFAQAEATGDQMIADLRAREAAERGEGKMTLSDAKRRARGQFAARNIDPSPPQLRALAESIRAAEPERLAALETERAINESKIKTAEAELNRPEFKGKVYTVDGVTFAQTSRGGVQVIDTGTEDPEAATAKMKDFEFTKKKIEEAREAYLAGDLTKANDILTAAKVQQYGIQANATQYFADSTPQVTPADPTVAVAASGLTQQQEAGIQRVMADNEMTREEAIKALKEAGKLK